MKSWILAMNDIDNVLIFLYKYNVDADVRVYKVILAYLKGENDD